MSIADGTNALLVWLLQRAVYIRLAGIGLILLVLLSDIACAIYASSSTMESSKTTEKISQPGPSQGHLILDQSGTGSLGHPPEVSASSGKQFLSLYIITRDSWKQNNTSCSTHKIYQLYTRFSCRYHNIIAYERYFGPGKWHHVVKNLRRQIWDLCHLFRRFSNLRRPRCGISAVLAILLSVSTAEIPPW